MTAEEDYSLEAVIDGLCARLVARPVDVRVTAVSNLYLIRAALANGTCLEGLVDRDADTDDLPWLTLTATEVRTRVGAALMVAWCQVASFAASHPLSASSVSRGADGSIPVGSSCQLVPPVGVEGDDPGSGFPMLPDPGSEP